MMYTHQQINCVSILPHYRTVMIDLSCTKMYKDEAEWHSIFKQRSRDLRLKILKFCEKFDCSTSVLYKPHFSLVLRH